MLSRYLTLATPIADGEDSDPYDQKPDNFYDFHKLSPFVNSLSRRSYCRSLPTTRSKSARFCKKLTVAL